MISPEHLSVFETAFFKGASGPFRDCLGKYSGRLLILGDGRGVWEDLSCYAGATQDFSVMGVKWAGAVYPRLAHWAQLHAEQWAHLEDFRKRRAGRQEGATVPVKHSYLKGAGTGSWDVTWPCMQGGNSALFAALVAVCLGYDEITLAGCPSDGKGHFYEPPASHNSYSGFECRGHEKNWKYCRDNYFFGKVKSLSGNTRSWLS